MGLTFVQLTAIEGNSSSSVSKAYDSATTLGSLLLLHVLDFAGGPYVISDTIGNTWAPVGAISSDLHQTFFAINKSSGANTVTVSGGASTIVLLLAEYTGQAAGANPIDQIFGATRWTETGTGTVNFSSLTTTFTNETLILFGRCDNNAVTTPQDGSTAHGHAGTNQQLQERTVSTAGTYSSSFSTNFSGNSGAATFFSVKSTTSVVGGSPLRTLMGVGV